MLVLAVASGILGVGVLGAAGAVAGEDDASKESVTVRKTADGLHFKVPPDWPIEKRGGITAPIPIEEYLARKFKALDVELQGLEQHLNGVEVRLRVLEEAEKKHRQGLRASSAPPSSSENAATPPAEPP